MSLQREIRYVKNNARRESAVSAYREKKGGFIAPIVQNEIYSFGGGDYKEVRQAAQRCPRYQPKVNNGCCSLEQDVCYGTRSPKEAVCRYQVKTSRCDIS